MSESERSSIIAAQGESIRFSPISLLWNHTTSKETDAGNRAKISHFSAKFRGGVDKTAEWINHQVQPRPNLLYTFSGPP